MNAKELKFKEWSERVAALAVDALVDAGFVEKDNFEEISSLVSEEIFIRLIIGDLPDPKALINGE